MSRLRTRALLLSTLLTCAEAASIPAVFQRDDTCGGSRDDDLSQCGRGLDDGLCCSSDTTCLFLAGGSTVLCCPESSCDRIGPIACDVNLQNPELFPNSAIKTTALQGELSRCGDNCCPFGYSCNDDNQCDMDADQSSRPSERPESEAPTSTSTPSSTLASPTIIPTSSSSGSSVSATSTSTAPAEEQQSDEQDEGSDSGGGGGGGGASTVGIIVGVLGGLLLLIAVGIGVVMFRARRKGKSGHGHDQGHRGSEKFGGACVARRSTSTSSFGNFISEPIPKEDSALRTDFILKTPSSTKTRASQRLSSVFGRNSTAGGNKADSAANGAAEPDHAGSAGLGLVAGPRSPPRLPIRTLSNATMAATNGHNNTLGIPPIRTMRNQQRPTFKTGVGKGGAVPRVAVTEATTPTDATAPASSTALPVTPRLQREPSSECINVFADPSTVRSDDGKKMERLGASAGLEPPRPHRLTSGTTFTDLMEEAQLGDVRRGKPYIPNTPGQ